jgi:hypothetical protein
VQKALGSSYRILQPDKVELAHKKKREEKVLLCLGKTRINCNIFSVLIANSFLKNGLLVKIMRKSYIL